MKSELKKHLDELKTGIVIQSSAGGGAGSIILMDIKSSSGILYTLWIECAWRIEKENKVIATSADDIEAVTGLIAKSAKMLEDKIIDFIEINSSNDLCVHLTDSFCLRVFCIFSYTCDCDINWRLSIPSENLYFGITNHFEIEKGIFDHSKLFN